MKYEFKVPIHLKTSQSQGWKRRWVTAQADASVVRSYLRDVKVQLPCKVVLTRHGKKLVDYDNLVFAFKAVRDGVADSLIPNKAPGQADGDPRIKFIYQQKEKSDHYFVTIAIEEIVDDKQA